MANDLLADHGQGLPKVSLASSQSVSTNLYIHFTIHEGRHTNYQLMFPQEPILAQCKAVFFSDKLVQVKLVFLDIEKGRIHLTNEPLTFYWSSHLDDQLTLYCSNTEFILQQQFLLEQGST